MSFHLRQTSLLLLVLTACRPASAAEITSTPTAGASERLDQLKNSPRYTPTVKLIAECLPSVVNIRTFLPPPKEGVVQVTAGSGAVIHQAGYILTNDHVVKNAIRGEVALDENRVYQYRVIARFPHEDLALIKIDADSSLRPLSLGRSHDLMLGEPVLVIGNPNGLAHSASTGIVSGLKRATTTQDAFLSSVIQTSAAVNGGNSGGPLINALGQQIGVITSKQNDAENINFAIAVDRIREVFGQMIAAEQRYGFALGLDIDMLAAEAKVTAVAADSPAARAGLKPDDIIVGVDQLPIRHGVDLQIALVDRKAGQSLAVEVAREPRETLHVTLGELPLAAPVVETDLVRGLHYEAYTPRGKAQPGQPYWRRVPDFSTRQPVETGSVERPTTKAYKAGGDHFALRFHGYVRVPADDLYTFYTASDDGSQLFVGDRLVVDNDGPHAMRESAGLVRLKAGLHPITITYYEGHGDESLKVFYEGGSLAKQEIPPDAFYTRAPDLH